MEISEKKGPSKKRNILFTVAFLFFLGLAIYSGAQIYLSMRAYAASANEYDTLREMYEPFEAVAADAGDNSPAETEGLPDPEEEEASPVESRPVAPPRDPKEVNSEYIGWLKISGTVISYPVVQDMKGTDNDKYLTTSFEGRRSGLGAIFMDFRCSGDFKAYHSIVYGHNAKNGTMFGSLAKYLDAVYMEKHREITVTLPNGTKEIWRVFAARKSDITDHAYRLVFSHPDSFAAFAATLDAPEGVSRILTLSTCTTGGSNDERMLVHAAIIDAASKPVEDQAEEQLEKQAEEEAEEQLEQQAEDQVEERTEDQREEQAGVLEAGPEEPAGVETETEGSGIQI